MNNEAKAITKRVQVDFTISTGVAFASGYAMHTGAVQLPNSVQYEGSGKITGVVLSDLDKKLTDLSVLFFKGDPSSSTITANAALDVDDADLLTFLGHVKIVAADYASFADNCAATKECKIPIDLDKENRGGLYVVLMSNDTDTFSTAGALSLSVFIEQD